MGLFQKRESTGKIQKTESYPLLSLVKVYFAARDPPVKDSTTVSPPLVATRAGSSDLAIFPSFLSSSELSFLRERELRVADLGASSSSCIATVSRCCSDLGIPLQFYACRRYTAAAIPSQRHRLRRSRMEIDPVLAILGNTSSIEENSLTGWCAACSCSCGGICGREIYFQLPKKIAVFSSNCFHLYLLLSISLSYCFLVVKKP